MRKNDDYVIKNAAFVAHRHVPRCVSAKFSIKNIIVALNSKNVWFENLVPIEELKKPANSKKAEFSQFKYEDMVEQIIVELSQKGIVINYWELYEIFRAEGIYFEALMGSAYVDGLIYYNDSRI